MQHSKRKKSTESSDELNIDQYSLDARDTVTTSGDEGTGIAATIHESDVAPEPVQRSGVEQARAKLDKLILQDLAVTLQRPQHAQRKSESRSRAARSLGKSKRNETSIQQPALAQRSRPEAPSQYVVDLRKHYLIEKYNLHTFHQPRKGWGERVRDHLRSITRRERIEWHYPERLSEKNISAPTVTLVRDEVSAPHPVYDELPVPDLEAVTPPLAQDDLAQVTGPAMIEAVPWHMRVYAVATFCVVLAMVIIPIPLISYVLKVSADGRYLWTQGMLAFSELKAGVLDISSNEYVGAQQNLREAQKGFSEIQDRLAGYATTVGAVAKVMPAVGETLGLAQAVGVIGEQSSAIGVLLSESLGQGETESAVTDRLKELQTRISRIRTTLIENSDSLRNVDPNLVPLELREQFRSAQDATPSLIASLEHTEAILAAAYTVLGGDNLSRYLIVFQNSRELRPTGGFMGSFALVDFSKGRPVGIEFPGGGTYDLEGGFKQRLVPPRPLSVLNQEWHIWDSNWWPDFPTSAQKIAWFYQHAGGRTVDGVIAVNSDFVVELLREVGPIEMPEYGLTISADTFYDVVQNEVEMGYDRSLNQPKKILKDLMPQLMERLMSASRYQQLIEITANALVRKDIQVAALTDAETGAAVRALGWDGAIKDAARDYLAVISTNIAGGKSDASIYQTIDHQATIDASGTVTVTTTITKEHRGDPSDAFAYVNNVDFIRLYVPLGSTLMRATGFQQPAESLFRLPDATQSVDPDLVALSGAQVIDQATGTTIGRESNKTVFGNWMQVAPGSRAVASVVYTLPFKVQIPATQGVSWLSVWGRESQEVDAYSLLVQTQSGKRNTIINSSVAVAEPFQIVWSDSVDAEKTGTTPNSFLYSDDYELDTYYALLLARKGD